MIESVAAVVAAFGAFAALIGWQSTGGGSGLGTCWSCGLRDQHKMWCPNR